MSNDAFTFLSQLIRGETGATGPTGPTGPAGPSGGGSSRVTKGVLFVDGSFSGTSTGALGAPFSKISDAIAGAVSLSYSSCQFMIAPGVYSDDLAIAGAVQYSFGPFVVGSSDGSYPGVRPIEISGTLTWTITDGSMVSFSSTNFDNTINCKDDVAAGTGTVVLALTGCLCEGVTKDQAGAFSHVLNMSMTGRKGVFPSGGFSILYLDSILDNGVTISGTFLADNTRLGGSVTGVTRVAIDSCQIQGNTIACGAESEITNSTFQGSSTLASNASGTIYMDPKSHYWWINTASNTQTGSGASIVVYS